MPETFKTILDRVLAEEAGSIMKQYGPAGLVQVRLGILANLGFALQSLNLLPEGRFSEGDLQHTVPTGTERKVIAAVRMAIRQVMGEEETEPVIH